MTKLFKHHHNSHIIVAFDVDDTLITVTNTPKYENIQLFNLFKKLGCHMIIWSGCGIDYATRWSEKLGLEAQILEKGSISPHIVFDDMETAMGIVAIQV